MCAKNILAFGQRDMKIVINALSVFSGGGLVGLLELLPALRTIDKGNEYVVVMAEAQHKIIGDLPDGIGAHVVKVNPRNVLSRILFEQFVMPILLWRIGADWLYSLGNQTVLMAPCKVCVVMENTNPYSRHPIAWSMRERVRLALLRVLATLSCWRATKVRFLTENSCRILTGRLGLPGNKVCVIPQGVKVHDSLSEESWDGPGRLPEKFVLTVSNLAPHKNIHTLLKGFDRFVQEMHYEGSLVIAGAFIYQEYVDELMQLKSALSSCKKIEFLGWVDHKHLGLLYRRADMFVFPSIEETFGIPVVEAMAYGVPLLVSRPPDGSGEHFIPFEEICGPAAVYFDPLSPAHLATQLERVYSDAQLRERLVTLGKARAGEFSWTAIASLLAREFSSN